MTTAVDILKISSKDKGAKCPETGKPVTYKGIKGEKPREYRHKKIIDNKMKTAIAKLQIIAQSGRKEVAAAAAVLRALDVRKSGAMDRTTLIKFLKMLGLGSAAAVTGNTIGSAMRGTPHDTAKMAGERWDEYDEEYSEQQSVIKGKAKERNEAFDETAEFNELMKALRTPGVNKQNALNILRKYAGEGDVFDDLDREVEAINTPEEKAKAETDSMYQDAMSSAWAGTPEETAEPVAEVSQLGAAKTVAQNANKNNDEEVSAILKENALDIKRARKLL